jgi:5-methylcytosine-specific restriction endonuclease McrA
MVAIRGSPYNTVAYRNRRRVFIATAPPICTWPACPVPGKAVDKRLSGTHPLGPSIDHRVAYSLDPTAFWDRSNWQLMHRRCNTAKGPRPHHPPTTRPW